MIKCDFLNIESRGFDCLGILVTWCGYCTIWLWRSSVSSTRHLLLWNRVTGRLGYRTLTAFKDEIGPGKVYLYSNCALPSINLISNMRCQLAELPLDRYTRAITARRELRSSSAYRVSFSSLSTSSYLPSPHSPSRPRARLHLCLLLFHRHSPPPL